MGQGVTAMRVDLPGLLIEKHRNGSPRIRVRAAHDKTLRTHVPVPLDHPDFLHHYRAARAGKTLDASTPIDSRTLDGLAARYLTNLAKMVQAGQASPATLKQRRSVLNRVCDMKDGDGDRYGSLDFDMPPQAFVQVRDAWAHVPGAADNMIKTVRALYAFAIERQAIDQNPAAGIRFINKPKGGAKPWTLADLKRFRDVHPKGTTAHLWLTLQAFAACRIGDAAVLGRRHEVQRGGVTYLEWQPGKKGSAFVSIPMLPPLVEAVRAVPVIGPTYVLNDNGQPFASTEALRVRVQRWITAAGLVDRSSHGIRKAIGDFLAEAGCTQHQIMAVMAHTQAKTSEIYTKGVNRRVLADTAMLAMGAMEW